MTDASTSESAQLEAAEKVARACRNGGQDQVARLREEWPDLAQALGKLMRATGRPSSW
ncbi:hypothetical protein [Actinomycetospora corticicola]|uniref:Uncharacterized protein n=1 Tax=Actinomycetospora corticicola TaxID=663602 RepID=A0A7Y9J690_9PSEU|nr:hypothetical protein [Actinomycetospora corticicola]NYD36801.1 hypothetical protein [Actinomycetospora corticicola]